jgi:hypothetical protein
MRTKALNPFFIYLSWVLLLKRYYLPLTIAVSINYQQHTDCEFGHDNS